MADFTTSYIGGEPSSPVSPLPPVVNESSLTTLNFLGNAVSALGGAAVNFAEVRREERKAALEAQIQAQQDQAISNFSRDQLKLVDATDMGDISSSEARMRMRANLSRYIADNPALATDLAKAHTSVIKSTGLGDVVYEGTEAEQQQKLLETDALKAGWLTPDMSNAQKQVAVDNYGSFKRQQAIIEDQTKRLNLQKAQVTLTTAGITQRSAKIDLAEKQARISTQQAIGSMANDFSSNLMNKLESIRIGKEEGKYTAEQAVMLADQAAFEMNQFVTQAGAKAGGDYIGNITKPMNSMVENYKGYISGKVKLDTLNTQNETTIAQQVLMMQGNPRVAETVAISKLFPNAAAVTTSLSNDAVVDLVRINSDPTTKSADILPDYDAGKDSVGKYLSLIEETAGKLNLGEAVDAEETKVEVNTHLSQVLNSIAVHGPSSQSKDFKQVIDFFASPSIGNYMNSPNAQIDEGAKFNAESMLNEVYSRDLYPLIQKTYKQSSTGGSVNLKSVGRAQVPVVEGQVPTTNVIKPVFTGSGIMFQAPAGDNNPITRRKVKDLNDSVGALLNKIIQAKAHMSGNKDYRAVWTSEVEPAVFGVEDDANANQE